MKSIDIPLRPVGLHTVNSSLSTAVIISINASARYILMQGLVQNIRYTLDGTTPTGTVGFQLKAGDPPIALWVETGVSLRVIEEAPTATLQYQFYN